MPIGSTNGREVEILNIEDDHSRLRVGSTARTVFKAGDIVTDLHAAIARYGRPERLLTDIKLGDVPKVPVPRGRWCEDRRVRHPLVVVA